MLASTVLGLRLAAKMRRRATDLRSERRRRQEAERESRFARESLTQAFTKHPDGMLISDAQGIVIEVNDALCRMFEKSPPELLGHALRDMAVLADSSILALVRDMLRARGWFENLPLEVRAADGATRYYVATGQRIGVDGVSQVFTIVREVSAAMRADAALRAEFEALAGATRDQARELGLARAQLQEGEQALQDFTAAVAHDLRAPLRALSGFSNLLRADLDAGNVADAIASTQRIEEAARRMDAMIDALTRLARSGRAALDHASVDMEAEARDAWRLIAAADPARNVEIAIAALPAAIGDAKLIGQVWQNLLDNAWKYTARTARPQVCVDSFAEGGRTWYRVSDNGAGFDMDQARHLFQPFHRMHGSEEFAGSGIGLSIVRRIVQAHRGEIRTRSSPGAGTVMEFSLQGVESAGGPEADLPPLDAGLR